MSLVLKVPAADADAKFAPAPAGVWPAVCTKIIDVGTQTEEYNGEISSARKLIIMWEIDSDERMSDGRAFAVSKWYTASLTQSANLRKLLVSWFGKAPDTPSFDIGKLLGRGCQIQIVHKADKTTGDVRAHVAAVMPLAKGMKAPAPSIAPFMFSLDSFDEDAFSALTDFQKKKVAASPEYKAIIDPPKPAPAPAPAPVPKKNGHSPAGFGGPRTNASRSEPASFDDDLSDEIPF